MKIKDILKGINYRTDKKTQELDVRNITDDSRKVRRNDLFVAVNGFSVNGSKFIADAVKNGASACVCDSGQRTDAHIPKIPVSNTRRLLPVLANNFYVNPSQRLKMVGITGTNGKTTITYIIEKILKEAGEEVGVIGTVNYRIKGKKIPATNTTPGPLQLQEMLSQMIRQDVGYAVMEVSSHALDQGRAEGTGFDAAIFTNVTGDHLDYHKTIKKYFAAKTKIFELLKKSGYAILNADDKKVASLQEKLSKKIKVITYGVNKTADVRAVDIELGMGGSQFTLITPKGRFRTKIRLVGEHNVSNILAAVAASLSLGIDLKIIKRGIEGKITVPGRLEMVSAGQSFSVYVDFAHTDDALRNVLGNLRHITAGKIVALFGCGGNRDRTKRPRMGVVACELADHVIITSDNPRCEEPSAIIKEITDGIRGRFENYTVVIDRRKAIERALRCASDGDIVVLAGKGHETYQIIEDKVIPFDDKKEARNALRKLGYRRPH